MQIGPRTHKRASLRIADPTALPEDMRSQVREIVSLTSEDRGKGHAKALMWQVCAEADRHWITLLLKVEPGQDTEAEKLEQFYAKLGFKRIQDEPVLMARSPQLPRIAYG